MVYVSSEYDERRTRLNRNPLAVQMVLGDVPDGGRVRLSTSVVGTLYVVRTALIGVDERLDETLQFAGPSETDVYVINLDNGDISVRGRSEVVFWFVKFDELARYLRCPLPT